MRFKNLDEWFKDAELGPDWTSREFVLNDGHSYYLVRTKLWSSVDYAYTLFCMDDQQRHTPRYMSELAIKAILARRDGVKLIRCVACGGTGEITQANATGIDAIQMGAEARTTERCEACEGRGELAP